MFDRKARILIADNTPLSVLSLLGANGLDWLFVPGAEVWVTDMVREEAVREPEPGSDQRHEQRQKLSAWFERNMDRIQIHHTMEGDEYRKAMETWRLAGGPPNLKPSWANRGETSIFQAMKAIESILKDGQAVLAIMDDRVGRSTLRGMNLDMDIMSTESFVVWMDEGFGVQGAETAWQTIKMRAPR